MNSLILLVFLTLIDYLTVYMINSIHGILLSHLPGHRDCFAGNSSANNLLKQPALRSLSTKQ